MGIKIKISELFDQSILTLSHQSVEDNVLEDGNLQVHEEIIDTIIEEKQSRQNSSQGIIGKLGVGIKSSGQRTLKIIIFMGCKDQLAVHENCEYIKVPLLNDILKNKHTQSL